MNWIVDNLYLGNVHDSNNRDLLIANGIRKVINVAIEFSPKQDDYIEHYKFDIRDEKDINDNLLEYVYNIIDSNNKVNVLIHCAHGKSRSACFTIYFVMKKLELSLKDAISYVKARRPLVSPSLNYIRLLAKHDPTSDMNYFYLKEIKELINDESISDIKIISSMKENDYDLNETVQLLMNLS